jgi:hypothetical protein
MSEVVAIVSARMKEHDVLVSVIGGSAVTLHAPESYTSLDIDFAVLSGIERVKIDRALTSLGYSKKGRNYVHADSPWTIDIVADTPFIGRRAIREFATIATQYGEARVLKIEDALADRVAHFLYWSDSEALAVAQALVVAKKDEIDWDAFDAAIEALEATTNDERQRLGFARRRLRERG